MQIRIRLLEPSLTVHHEETNAATVCQKNITRFDPRNGSNGYVHQWILQSDCPYGLFAD